MKFPDWPIPLGSKPITLGLERVFHALKLMGNPHYNLPPVIHVAGTNGKGSTIAFLRSILEASGKTCHVYTSPHLVEFNERIVLAGKEISDKFLNEVLQETKSACDSELQLSFFEGTTLAAILAFSKVNADYLLLETGLGGRLDATNIMGQAGAPKPVLTIITPISLDHTEYLGETVEEIAAEKAEIIKRDVTCIVGKQDIKASKVIQNVAKSKDAKLLEMGHDFDYDHKSSDNEGFKFSLGDKVINFAKPGLLGDHQYHNASVAVAAALNLESKISDNNLNRGVKNACWKARMQKISTGKIAKLLRGNEDIYLDGGHNEAAAVNISNFILDENSKIKKTNVAIIGMLKRKDAKNFLLNIKDAFEEIIFCPIEGEESAYSPIEIQNISSELNIKSKISNSIEDALSQVKSFDQKNSRLVICGSLYLAGQVLEFNSK